MGQIASVPIDILKTIEERLVIHEDNLEKDLIDTTYFETDFIKYLYEAADGLTAAEIKLKEVKRQRYLDYLTGNTGDPKIDNRALKAGQVEMLLDGDSHVLTALRRVEEYQNIVKFYENTLKSVKQKSMNINTILKFRRFMNGENVAD
mgnify:CR=1 FL=1